MKHCLAYARVSTLEQAQKQTIEPQVEALLKYVTEHDLEIVGEIYQDNGVSGADEDRALRLVTFLQSHSGEIDFLLVTYLDRLARELYLQMFIEKECKKLGIEIVATQQKHLNGDDPFSNAFRQMVGVFAELEKRQIVLRLSQGIKFKELKGQKAHGKTPYGYYWWRNPADRKDKKVIPDPEESAAVLAACQYILEPVPSGMKGKKAKNPLSRAAQRLNWDGYKRRDGGIWMPSTLVPVLANPFNCGFLKVGEVYFQGQHEPLISVSQYRAILEVLRKHAPPSTQHFIPSKSPG
jgi:DNA invertase Pin-like site-specific DNA recombinase